VVEDDGSEPGGGAEDDARASLTPWEDLEGAGDRTWIPQRLRVGLETDRTTYWTVSAPGCGTSGPYEVAPKAWGLDLLKRWLEAYRERYDLVGPLRVRIRGGTPRRDLDTLDVVVPEPEPEPSRWERILEQTLRDPAQTGRALRVVVAEVGPGIREALGVGVGELLDVVAESSAAKVIEKLKAEEGL